MFEKMKDSLFSSEPQHLAKSFRRLGWTAFWLQLVLATLPVILLIYVVLFSQTKGMQRGGPFVATKLSAHSRRFPRASPRSGRRSLAARRRSAPFSSIEYQGFPARRGRASSTKVTVPLR